MSEIRKIIIHCAATPDGKKLGKAGQFSAAEVIDKWHAARGFRRRPAAMKAFNPHLTAIGYHFVIDTDGEIARGRKVGETGAHVKGQNSGSIGICLVGTRRFTQVQWEKLSALAYELSEVYDATIHGHREFAAKECPGFDVQAWLARAKMPQKEQVYVSK